jgi:hypothetical protein
MANNISDADILTFVNSLTLPQKIQISQFIFNIGTANTAVNNIRNFTNLDNLGTQIIILYKHFPQLVRIFMNNAPYILTSEINAVDDPDEDEVVTDLLLYKFTHFIASFSTTFQDNDYLDAFNKALKRIMKINEIILFILTHNMAAPAAGGSCKRRIGV